MSTVLIAVRDTVKSILNDSLGKIIPENQKILEILKSNYPEIVTKATQELLDDGLQKLVGDEIHRIKRTRGDPLQTDLFQTVGLIIEIDGPNNKNIKIKSDLATLSEIRQSIVKTQNKQTKQMLKKEKTQIQKDQVDEMILVSGNDQLTLAEYLSLHPRN